MRTSDFTSKPTAKVMNETLSKKFGEKLDIDNYSLEQLQKASSLIENRIAVLKKGKFNETLNSEEFHRLKLMQDIVKTAISEAVVNPFAAGTQKAMDITGDKPPLKKSTIKKAHEIGKAIKKSQKNESIYEGVAEGQKLSKKQKEKIASKAGDPNKIDADDFAALRAEKKNKKTDEGKKSMKESYEYLYEGEEGKAELIMAVKDMVDKFTGWSEDIAQMQAQTAMEMADAIRDEMGADQAEAFTAAVQPALDAAFQSVKSAREALNNSVASLTGQSPTPMGAEPEMDADMDTGMEPSTDVDAEVPGDDAEMDLDVDTAAPVDRSKRESIEHRLRLTKILVGR